MLSRDLTINRCKIVYKPDIALAMYRELASHIEQVEDVTTELFWQESTDFSYLGSQIGGMWMSYPHSLPEKSQVLIKNILNHYGNWMSDPKELKSA